METPSTNITTWSRILDGDPSHGLSDTLGRKRRRRTSSTSEVSGKRKVSKVNTTDPKRVKVKTRLEEYPNEPFQDVLGRLWCSCCNTEVSLKRSSISLVCGFRSRMSGLQVLGPSFRSCQRSLQFR